ncbi:GNAT family N-acetyltransferase [Natronococcus pandeyae]|uniref:GNAT family N-acetyltransferase n=1 Tax=Natronococcus pandeyae TaxID=2055836 RepID=A0A8J8Q2L5_9EURY|nr:arsenic resistance N-acetyltransferase ArsN2 [Natronococcus pandeyae]TYL38251.1 GNAT family N-acetyltransferase [Natronococcus pandeyae]
MDGMSSVTLHPAEGDLDYARDLLNRNDLPVQDLAAAPAEFYYATADGERVGIGGLERYEDVGLLRSVVVEAPKRGQGYGTTLCEALETAARDNGIETLYLLTTTASAFFAAEGYSTVERPAVPDAIRSTTEFTDLCPSTATCMRKSL